MRRAQFSGRILRLFETGQLEEARLVRNLRATGATVLDVDPRAAGSGRSKPMAGILAARSMRSRSGSRSAEDLARGRVQDPLGQKLSRPRRQGRRAVEAAAWAQMQIYMHLTGITRALYVAVCKDTDDLHIERVRADGEAAARLLEKARRVIEAKRPPARIAEDPDWWECRFCDHHDVCHDGAAAEITCRSCLHATPIEGGWHCARFDHALDRAAQRRACPKHLFVPDLVPGEVADAGDDHVVYRMASSAGSMTRGRLRDAELAPVSAAAITAIYTYFADKSGIRSW